MLAERQATPATNGVGSAFVLAIDFGGSKTAVATVDPRGQIVATERLGLDKAARAEEIVADAARAGRRLLEAAPSGPCVGVGVARPGIPSAEGVLLSPNLPSWDRVRLAEEIADAFGIAPVVVANDVKCAALAEHRWGALRDVDLALYVNLGSGVGAATVVSGRVLDGTHGGAGEIGYAAGRIPEPDRVTSTLEDMVGGRRLAERASELAGRTLTTREVFDSDEPALANLADDALATLGAHLRTLVLAFDPTRVALGGGLMGHAERVLRALRRHLSVPAPFSVDVVAGQFLYDAALRGAAAVALDAVRGGADA